MAPKKKGNNKGNDDWEAELGESIAPADAQPINGENGDAAPVEGEEDGENAGGLMAMLKKRKERRKQKGLPEEEGTETVGEPQLATAQEANADDEFALPDKKGKGGKGKQQNQKKPADEVVDDNSGKILTKAEKEKLKKEREKQRKKEQVRRFVVIRGAFISSTKAPSRPQRRSPLLQPLSQNLRNLPQTKSPLLPPPKRLLRPVARRRRSRRIWLLSKSNKRNYA